MEESLREEIYCNAISSGGEEEFDFAWARFQTSRDMVERETLLGALCCARETWLLNRCIID